MRLGQARAGLGDGDAGTALGLAGAALAIKRTAWAYVVRADALRRLARQNDALDALDQAIQMANEFAPAWELRGRILWSMRGRDAARAGFATYLQLEPTGARADAVRAQLASEPK